MTKQFQLPTYLPRTDNENNFREKFRAAESVVMEHLRFLNKQCFCLALNDCLETFPQIEELIIYVNDGKYGLSANVLVNGKPDFEDAITQFINNSMSEEHMKYLGLDELAVSRKNIQAAWATWMGDEDWAKWKALDTEDNLRKISRPQQQKRKSI